MNYGYFDNKNKEYIITNPRTPVKWINYTGRLEFGGIIDHTGGSTITKGDPALNRIVKYIPQLPASDFNGETLYLRVKTKDGYKVFSPFYVPTLHDYDMYECHVGLGYQRIISEFFNIRTDVNIFVPDDADVVLRDIKITNLSDREIEIDVIPVVEFSHFDALKQFTNADWVPQTMMVDAETKSDGTVVLKQYAFMKKDSANNFFTSNFKVDSFQTDRKLFLGSNGYGSWKNPLELQNPSLSDYQARRGDNIAALLHKAGTVQPGQTIRIITQLGQTEPDNIDSCIKKYKDEKAVDTAFERLKKYWDAYLDNFQCDTPDKEFNSMVNIHNPAQCHVTFNWSRYLSLYQLGLGARGLGFRDSSQDIAGILYSMKDDAKKLIKKLLSVQKPDGSAMHQFFPSTMEANEGDSREKEGKRFYGDDHLWIVLAVSEYLKETGDFEILNEEISYYQDDVDINLRPKGTVFEHLTKALDFTKNNTGAHGLPLLGFADWNDTVNLPGDAESTFIAALYGYALTEMIELLKYLDKPALVEQYQKDFEKMSSIFNQHCWDGEWFVRYFDENGNPLGSAGNNKGKIYTNAQSWSVLSNFASQSKASIALQSVNKHLNTKYGIKLATPGYNGFDPEIGGISTYPPGAKENGGIFLHANPWMIIAETMIGNGNRAFQYYNQINPASKNDIIDIYECEPYCYAQNILGDEHPQFGLARNSWLSGTSSWMYQAATKYILGIKPTYKGLKIDPCIPDTWDGFSVTRKYRNAVYDITVKNPNHISKGIKSIFIDNIKTNSNIIPVFDDNKTHKIEAIMG